MKRTTKRAIKRKLTNFSLELLEWAKEGGDLIVEIVSTPYGKLSMASRSSYYRSVKRLKEEKLIKPRKNYPNTYILTRQGERVLRSHRPQVRRTDGLSTIIIFDVPEEKSRQRTTFRRYLLRNGYINLQKSVMISAAKLDSDIIDLSRELRINECITILSAKINHFAP